MRRPSTTLGCIVLLAAVASALYFHQLGSSAPYLSIEEVSQARDALILATTGRGLDGQRLPLYFREPGNPFGREPVFIYIAAAFLTLLPFSEAVLRAPSALCGVLNVVLMFLLGREIFGRTGPAIVAALVLMLTPVHFLQSRIGHMQIGTVTCTLMWLVMLTRYFNTHRARDVFWAGAALGLGVYVYGGGLLMMPVYLLVTLLVVHRHQGAMASGRLMATGLIAVSAGFLMAALPLALWYVRHLDRIHQLADYYTVGEYNKNLGWRGFLGAGAIAHLDAWWDCYSPDKLFFGGDADLRFSTRSVGYFFLPAAVPLVAGLLAGRRFVTADVWTLLILGLVLSPLPAAFVSNSEAKRWLSFVPFAVLVTTCGVEWLRGAGSTAAQVTAIALLPIARWLTFVPSAVLAGVSGAAWLFAAKRHAAMIGLTALLWLSAIQMRDFFAYYFGLYRVDAAAYFGGNLPGAIRHVLAITGPEDCVLLDTRVYYLDDEWPLYARGNHRLELTTRTTWYGPEAAVTPPSSCGALTALGLAGDQRLEGWQSMLVPELDGKTRFAVYRRDAR